jgi:hypothetical protein
MRRLAILLLSLAGCTRSNPNAFVCVPNEQRECACVGGAKGIQVCNPGGDLLSDCLGCPGGPQLDLSLPFGTDLAVADLSFTPEFDFPPGTDLTGFNPFADFSTPPEDLSIPDVLPRCPIVMLAFDNSSSMSTGFTGGGVTHLEGAKAAINEIVDRYGARVPFGLTRFATPSMCSEGIQIVVPPMSGTATAVKNGVNAAVADGIGNVGNAMQSIAAEPAMHDPGRDGSFVVLVTDGQANCETDDPSFTATVIGQMASAAAPIKTYVVGIDIPDFDEAGVDQMAQPGGEPCQGGFCRGHSYYPGDTQSQLAKALDLVINDIVSSVPGCGGFGCFPSGAACGGSTTCCGVVGCKNLQNDAQNCGSCGAVCASGTCVAGQCTSLDMSQADLRQQDLRPATDLRNTDINLPACVCSGPCFTGCKAANCCSEDTGCTATPDVCTCTGAVCF